MMADAIRQATNEAFPFLKAPTATEFETVVQRALAIVGRSEDTDHNEVHRLVRAHQSQVWSDRRPRQPGDPLIDPGILTGP